MQKLDENGRFVPAGKELGIGRDTRRLERQLLDRYPCVLLEKTNLSQQMVSFVCTVLANLDPDLAKKGYFALRPYLAQRAQEERLVPKGYLLLDEKAAHALYAAQPPSPGGAFGRSPIVVFFEHTTGTVLVDGIDKTLSEAGELC